MAYIRQEMKQEAKSQLSGKWGAVVGAFALFAVISGLISVIFYVDPNEITEVNYSSFMGLSFLSMIISLIVMSPLNLGWYILVLEVMRDLPVAFSHIFKGFKRIWAAIFTSFLYALFVSLWTLLLIIPGIIKSYSYAMCFYILADNDDVGALEAITRSRHMMNGHKGELFVLQLSFIPWFALCVITLGIACFYVMPYYNVTVANFYRRLKAENENESRIGHNEDFKDLAE